MSTFEQQQKHIQSWHEPALRTLSGLLKKRKENLARQNRDEKNAAVTRDEFMQAFNGIQQCAERSIAYKEPIGSMLLAKVFGHGSFYE